MRYNAENYRHTEISGDGSPSIVFSCLSRREGSQSKLLELAYLNQPIVKDADNILYGEIKEFTTTVVVRDGSKPPPSVLRQLAAHLPMGQIPDQAHGSVYSTFRLESNVKSLRNLESRDSDLTGIIDAHNRAFTRKPLNEIAKNNLPSYRKNVIERDFPKKNLHFQYPPATPRKAREIPNFAASMPNTYVVRPNQPVTLTDDMLP